jgi:hypothetical protein
MTQCVKKQVGVLAAVEAERHLVQVGREMLCADLVPRPQGAPLKLCLGGGCSVATEPLAVVDARARTSSGQPTGARSLSSKAASQKWKCLSLSAVITLDFHADFKLIMYTYSYPIDNTTNR